MTRTREIRQFATAAAVAGIIGAGLTVAPLAPSAQAACNDWVFPGNVTFTSWPYTFSSNNKFVPSSITYVNPTGGANGQPKTEPRAASGGINGSNISIVINGDTYGGTIDPNGIASGKISLNNANWTLAQPLKCNSAPATKCPEGSVAPEVPADQKCAARTNAVTMNISKRGLTNATVEINNTGAIGGTCSYDASSERGVLPSVARTVNLAPNGNATITDLLWPPLGSTYNVVLSCKGNYNGSQVEFGHVEQRVSSF